MEKINKLIRKITYDAVIINKKDTSKFLKNQRDFIIKERHVKPVHHKDQNNNFILINSKENLQKSSLDKFTFDQYSLTIKPEQMTYQEILEQLLPKDINVPSSFETMGSIAMVYLKPNQIQYKEIIGEAILVANKSIKTVFNKSEKLTNVFRTPQLELIAGDDNKEVLLVEDGIKMKFSIDEVYFCSRLHSERKRIYQKYLKKNQIVVDVFCGIGPLCLWAEKKQCVCYANDLNPQCFKYLKENIKLNKAKNIQPYCEDGGNFILRIFNDIKSNALQSVDHFYMNLPALAITFIHKFQQVPDLLLNKGFYVHVYCFEEMDTDENQKKKIENILKEQLDEYYKYINISEIHQVKNVSSKKSMLCVTFYMQRQKSKNNLKKIKVNQQ